MGFDFPEADIKKSGPAILLRKNGGSVHHHVKHAQRIDPATFCHTPEDYWNFAGQFEEITTDRLHLAICALGMKTKATLLPINYHKNLAMYEEWLAPLGCHWKNTVIGY